MLLVVEDASPTKRNVNWRIRRRKSSVSDPVESSVAAQVLLLISDASLNARFLSLAIRVE
jgi:hypothetical protein